MRISVWICDADDFGSRSLDSFIEDLQGLRACGLPLMFEVEQTGDRWDGWGQATLSITREETAEELASRIAVERENELIWERRLQETERAQYEILKAKFESSSIPSKTRESM